MLRAARRLLLAAGFWLCTGMALAQTAPSTQPITKTSASASASRNTSLTAAAPTASTSSPTQTTATSRPKNTGEIFRWVDSQGRVQYGADVPEERRATARKIDTKGNIVSSRVPERFIPQPPLISAESSLALPQGRQPITEREKCEAVWAQYNEAQACFAQYRQGTTRGAGKKSGSNVAPEALEACQSLPEPAACR